MNPSFKPAGAAFAAVVAGLAAPATAADRHAETAASEAEALAEARARIAAMDESEPLAPEADADDWAAQDTPLG